MPTLRALTNTGTATWSNGVPTTLASPIAAATLMSADDSGGIFTVSQAVAPFAITLPTPTGPGIRYMFQIGTIGANAVTIGPAVAGPTFTGVILNDLTPVAVPNTAVVMNFLANCILGDSIEVISTSATGWFVRAITSTAGRITSA